MTLSLFGAENGAKKTLEMGSGRPPTGQHILVIDDDASILDLFEALLSEEGYEVSLCRDSATAYRRLGESEPAAIILDLHLETPRDGLQILEFLIEDPYLRQVPVIVCSGASRYVQQSNALLMHSGVALLPKPFHIDDLLSLLHRLMDARGVPGDACPPMISLPASSLACAILA